MATILLLEALPAIREYLRMEVERMGHSVIGSVGDGRIGLQQIQKDHPDLVILGLSMPGKSGLDLIDRIKAHAPSSRLLVYTALSAEHFAPLCLKAGVNGFVSKMDELDVLRSSIQSVLNGRSHYPAMMQRAPEGDVLSGLSPRELSVLQLMGEGKSNQEIADLLSISFKTVSTHKSHLQEKLRLTSRIELVEVARRHGLGQSSINYGFVTTPIPEQWKAHVDRLQAILDGVGHPMFLRDTDGRLLLCNRSFLKFYQVAAKDVEGQNFQSAAWFEFAERERIEAKYKEHVANGQPWDIEHSTKVYGTERLLRLWGLPYRDDKGKILGMVGGIRDLTDEYRMMSELREERRQALITNEERFELFELILVELNDVMAGIRRRIGDSEVAELAELVGRLTKLVGLARHNKLGIEELCDVPGITIDELGKYEISTKLVSSSPLESWLDVTRYRDLLGTLARMVGINAEALLEHKRNGRGLVEFRVTLISHNPTFRFSITLLRTAELIADRLGARVKRGRGTKSFIVELYLDEVSSASMLVQE